MLVVPTFATPTHYRLYRDSQDETLLYVDSMRPTPVHDEGLLWLLLSEDQAYSSGEVQFGPCETDLQQTLPPTAAQSSSARSLPVPWQPGPVYAWCQQAEGVHLLGRGQTSGYGLHNAVFNGTAGPEAMAAPVAIAAELHCSGQLAHAQLRGGGQPEAVAAALEHLPLGDQAPKLATLADVLLPTLRQLINAKALILLANAENLSIEAIEELRQLALMEWAHRILSACQGENLSLAMPAAQVSSLVITQPLTLDINWFTGESIPIRVVRVLRVRGSCPPLDAPGPPITVTVAAEGDWQSFDYVQVFLNNNRSQTEVTLTPKHSSRPCQLQLGEAIQSTAIAGVRRFGVKVPIEAVHVEPDRVTVRLAPLVEKAFLVKAARSLLQQVGPLAVSLTHPAIAQVIVPQAAGSLTLSASQGELAQVSAVYRALLWQAQQTAPFEIAVQPAHGATVRWSEVVTGDEIAITPARLPRLQAIASPLESDGTVTVELAQARQRPQLQDSLGEQTLTAQTLATWVYGPQAGDLWMRSRYTVPTDSADSPLASSAAEVTCWTDWHVVHPDGVVQAPAAQKSQVVFLPAPDFEAIAVEVSPLVGEGEALRRPLRPGQATPITFVHDVQDRAIRYRLQHAEATWSDWTTATEPVVRLNVNAPAL
ncbi:MAG: hypothetical protein AAGF01_09890 [Cyanobacteria bacterium P01_G01_bin.38]